MTSKNTSIHVELLWSFDDRVTSSQLSGYIMQYIAHELCSLPLSSATHISKLQVIVSSLPLPNKPYNPQRDVPTIRATGVPSSGGLATLDVSIRTIDQVSSTLPWTVFKRGFSLAIYSLSQERPHCPKTVPRRLRESKLEYEDRN